uniref:ATP synthase subunit a n=1 Tax=Cornu aspersum TaxID=6535 RepID=S4SAJ1_CORAP|nr:ATP synthase F0 subunit 6 [Cornu aspersum]
MTDLFSSLDGASLMSTWLPGIMILLIMTTMFSLQSPLTFINNLINNTWSSNTNSRFNCFTLILITIFTFIMFTNLLGLTPFTYTLTSDLLPMLSMGTLLWLLLLISGYSASLTKSLAHLAPSGAPTILLPFLVLIETISLLIRPLTLTVRLIANISAGHIVLALLANTLSAMFMTRSNIVMLIGMLGYVLFEFFVAIIQAYIFTLLISLYQAEHP